MIFAVIPWAEKFNNNEIFNVASVTNKNGLAEPYADMKKRFEEKGHIINTIDMYNDLSQVDYFLFFDWFPEWIYKLSGMGFSDRMVYCNAEPPTVRSLNSLEGYQRLKRFFPYIMTWNKDVIDNKRFFYRTIPYNFTDHVDNTPFIDKKLLTSISANKKSNYKDELYTEREKLITFFENTVPDQFDMYGVGWDKAGHSSYKGRPESKFETYNGYKFALALENTKNVKGYVTEKIFDCLTGNIVPVYMGADDICDYVSDNCFIDYRKFDSPKDLLDYLLSIDENQYKGYLDEAKKVISSKELQYKFSGKMYADNVLTLANNANMQGFKIDAFDRLKIGVVVNKNLLKRKIKAMINRWTGKR